MGNVGPGWTKLGPCRIAGTALVALAAGTSGTPGLHAQSLQAFWDADDDVATEVATRAIVESGISWTTVHEALRQGRDYSNDVPRGRIEAQRTNRDGKVHRYFYHVPPTYDATRNYPVRFYLHGGVSRGEPERSGGWWRGAERLVDEARIAVFPASWNGSLWWQESQVENLRGILSDLKRRYNVDENRVTLTGVSDGGTGAYFFAFKDTTPWASFLPFIGSPGVLLNPRIGADGRMHVGNLTNKPLYIVNGEHDRLYPVSSVEPYLGSFAAVGVPLEFHPNAGGHDTDFWPDLAENIDDFHRNFPRDPLPERLVWAAEDPSRYARAHWLVIDQVGPIAGDETRSALAALTEAGQSGVVRATRRGNTVEVEAYHVPRMRLLISPDEFDVDRPIRVEFNGTPVFDERVNPDVATLLKWAALDRDRQMLFVAEVTIDAPKPGPS